MQFENQQKQETQTKNGYTTQMKLMIYTNKCLCGYLKTEWKKKDLVIKKLIRSIYLHCGSPFLTQRDDFSLQVT